MYKKFINSFNSLYKKDSLRWKQQFSKSVKKGDLIHLGYHEHQKEDTKLETYQGYCIYFRSKGINSKLKLFINLKNSKIQVIFFLFNIHLYDIKINKHKVLDST